MDGSAGQQQQVLYNKKRTRREIAQQAKEESLGATLAMLEDFAPIIPDAVTDYHLARGGLQTDDVRLYPDD